MLLPATQADDSQLAEPSAILRPLLVSAAPKTKTKNNAMLAALSQKFNKSKLKSKDNYAQITT